MGQLGLNPGELPSTPSQLADRYQSGELDNGYGLIPFEGLQEREWFEPGEYDSEDGFHPRCQAYEFTQLWYQIMGERLDEAKCGEWSVAHGGLRWEYYGGAECSDLRATVDALIDVAALTYKAVVDELVSRGVPVKR